jgi:acyl-CoA thioesterase
VNPHPTTLPERVAAAMLANDSATTSLGMRVDSVGEFTATLSMPVRADMLNGHATCHGGFIFALADSAFAFACNSDNQRTVAAGCQIDYVRPVHEGDELRAVATVQVQGLRLGVFDVQVSNQYGKIVALFRGKSSRIGGSVIDEHVVDVLAASSLSSGHTP